MKHIEIRQLLSIILLGCFILACRLSGYEIMLLGDLHYDAHDLKVNYSELPVGRQEESKRNFERWEQCIPQMLEAAGKRSKGCAFAVQLGDLVQGDFCRENLHSEALRRASTAVADRMECPTYFVMGNHDIRGPFGETAYAKTILPLLDKQLQEDKQFQKVYRGKGANYALRLQNDLFIMSDFKREPDVAFVEDVLSKERDVRHVFYLAHIPIFPCSNNPRGWVLLCKKDSAHNRLLNVLSKRNAIALCAHTHAPSYFVYKFKDGSIRQLVTFSMPTSETAAFKRENDARVKEFLKVGGKRPIDASALRRYLDALQNYEFYLPRGGYVVLHVGEKSVDAELFYGDFEKSSATVNINRLGDGNDCNNLEREKMKVNVNDYGAKGDGKYMNTEAVAKALAELEKRGGGTLVFPAGEFLCGAVKLIDNLTIVLEKGAVLKASPNIADHKSGQKHFGGWLDQYFIYGQGIRNLKITGEGEIDGNGRAYWEDVYYCGVPFDKMPPNPSVIHYNVLKPKNKRPVLLYLEDCRNIAIDGVTLRNSACYTVWTVSCRQIAIQNVRIRNLRYGPNTDALDIDCSQEVTIKNCDIDAGDDCIAVKSDPNRFGRMEPSENITVEDCKLSSSTCAIRIGYEGDAPIRNLTFRNLDIVDSRHGIDILSIAPVSALKIEHGTPMDNFRFENIRMNNVGQAFFLWAGNESPRKEYDGHIRNILFKDIKVQAVASSFIGNETAGKISGITFDNVDMHVADLKELKPVTDFSKMPSHWGDWWRCGALHLHNSPDVNLLNCRISCDQQDFQPIEKSGLTIQASARVAVPTE